VFGDAEIHIAALQLRVALTDRLGLVATKDGYAWIRPGLSPFLQLSGIHHLTSGDGKLEIDTDLGTLPLAAVQAAVGTGAFEGANFAALGSEAVDTGTC